MKTIEVDPRVPGIRDEIPFPQAKQCSPELDSPSSHSSVRLVRIYSVVGKTYRHRIRLENFKGVFARVSMTSHRLIFASAEIGKSYLLTVTPVEKLVSRWSRNQPRAGSFFQRPRRGREEGAWERGWLDPTTLCKLSILHVFTITKRILAR